MCFFAECEKEKLKTILQVYSQIWGSVNWKFLWPKKQKKVFIMLPLVLCFVIFIHLVFINFYRSSFYLDTKLLFGDAEPCTGSYY